ncbi:MAG: HNH endonuclease [Phycisphaerae bacterium]|nr:HNH endonuclease [Phycisphaerae bacterium]
MANTRRAWTREESILAFNLYCKIPFGKLHHTNPAIIHLSEILNRTPSSVSMKMCNFSSLDPTHQKRNVKGLSHGSKLDKIIWDEFNQNWEELAFQSESTLNRLHILKKDLGLEEKMPKEFKHTEASRHVRVRLVQRFFREAVLSGYHYSCAICSINLPTLLNASHIIPWSKDKTRRVDPKNGVSLCALHDRAFDRGLITFDEKHKIIVSKQLFTKNPSDLHRIGLIEIEGHKIKLPERFKPAEDALDYHRNRIFLQ